MIFSVDVERCAGCGLCVESCPRGAIHLIEGAARINPALCIGCGICARSCPQGAIEATVPVGWRAYSPLKIVPSEVRPQLRNLRAKIEFLEEELDWLMERFRRLEQAKSRR